VYPRARGLLELAVVTSKFPHAAPTLIS
jgi:hypothetical protein